MKKFMALAVLAILFGCGGGGGGSDATTPAVTNAITGHYTLEAFVVNYKSGVNIDSKSLDRSRWSGTMDIYPNGYARQAAFVDGKQVFRGEGWILMHKPEVRKIFVQTGNCRYEIDYWWVNPILTTQTQYACGLNYKEKDTWKKVSEIPAANMSAQLNGADNYFGNTIAAGF